MFKTDEEWKDAIMKMDQQMPHIKVDSFLKSCHCVIQVQIRQRDKILVSDGSKMAITAEWKFSQNWNRWCH